MVLHAAEALRAPASVVAVAAAALVVVGAAEAQSVVPPRPTRACCQVLLPLQTSHSGGHPSVSRPPPAPVPVTPLGLWMTPLPLPRPLVLVKAPVTLGVVVTTVWNPTPTSPMPSVLHKIFLLPVPAMVAPWMAKISMLTMTPKLLAKRMSLTMLVLVTPAALMLTRYLTTLLVAWLASVLAAAAGMVWTQESVLLLLKVQPTPVRRRAWNYRHAARSQSFAARPSKVFARLLRAAPSAPAADSRGR
mmetsp:Transcript_65739/g.165699  ORF Transcript_65739/g.165699 Transcript_65739/m.165699 type:complete len:247 (-) Transcript_65739:265-1005(-)